MWQMGWGHPGQVSALQGTLCCLFDMVPLCDLSLKITHKKDLLAKTTLNIKLFTVKSLVKTWIQNICSRNTLFCYLSFLVKAKFLQLYGLVWEWPEKRRSVKLCVIKDFNNFGLRSCNTVTECSHVPLTHLPSMKSYVTMLQWSKPGNYQWQTTINQSRDVIQILLVFTCTFLGGRKCIDLWNFITCVDSYNHHIQDTELYN